MYKYVPPFSCTVEATKQAWLAVRYAPAQFLHAARRLVLLCCTNTTTYHCQAYTTSFYETPFGCLPVACVAIRALPNP